MWINAPITAALASWMTIIASFFYSTLAADPSQLVRGLPGQPHVTFNQYAGQITINSTTERALFYWFYEADHPDASSLPLALWLSGGPGCSSVGAGALMELGPFRVHANGKGLVLNPDTWNKAANLIFLESPYGVGFSYSKSASDDLDYNDNQTASDALQFLLEWFKIFPEYSRNDFYLLGESYAGHYVPTLASKILEHNLKQESAINLKGLAVCETSFSSLTLNDLIEHLFCKIGNAWTDAYFDNRGDTEFYYTHSIIPEDTYNELINNCDFANDLPVNRASSNPKCQAAVNVANRLLDGINHYNIYAPACNSGDNLTRKRNRFLHHKMLAAAYDPCADSVTPYLNLPDVQSALHVLVTKPEGWFLCNNTANLYYRREDITASMLPLYKQLLHSKLKIWIYSGDVDGVVSTLSTRSWLNQLNLTTEIPWYAWDYKNQVGGWAQVYSGLTFTTVRGSGHMVPKDKPQQALAIFEHFLNDRPLPSF